VLCLQGRRRGPSLQPAPDRRRHRKKPLTAREAKISASDEHAKGAIGAPASRRVRFYAGAGAVVALHLAALAILLFWEYGLFRLTLALLAWVFANCLLLLVLRRPGVSA